MVTGRFLLDTNALIWALADPDRLTTAANRAIRKGPNVVSVASYWEVVIKSQKGTLRVADPVAWWNRAIDQLTADILSILPPHVTAMAGLPPIHKDPFDRMLIAQAAAEGLTLVTGDEAILKYPVRTPW